MADPQQITLTDPQQWLRANGGSGPSPTLQDPQQWLSAQKEQNPLDDGFIDSFVNGIKGVAKSLTVGVYNDLRPHSAAERQAAVDKGMAAFKAYLTGTPDEKAKAREQMISAVPMGSTEQKFERGNVAGGLGDLGVIGAVAGAAGLGSSDVPGALMDAAKAGGGDVAAGAAKAAGGELLAKVVPGMEWPVRIGVQYPAVRQIGAGITKGVKAYRDAMVPDVAPNIATAADFADFQQPPPTPPAAPNVAGSGFAADTQVPMTADDVFPQTAAAAPVEDVAHLNAIAKSLGAKNFKTLTADQQALVRKIAQQPEAPAPQPSPVAPAAAAAPPPPEPASQGAQAAPAEAQVTTAQNPATLAQALKDEMQQSGTLNDLDKLAAAEQRRAKYRNQAADNMGIAREDASPSSDIAQGSKVEDIVGGNRGRWAKTMATQFKRAGMTTEDVDKLSPDMMDRVSVSAGVSPASLRSPETMLMLREYLDNMWKSAPKVTPTAAPVAPQAAPSASAPTAAISPSGDSPPATIPRKYSSQPAFDAAMDKAVLSRDAVKMAKDAGFSDEVSSRMMDMATRRLMLSADDVNGIIKTAQAVNKVDGGPLNGRQLAEAIQYRSPEILQHIANGYEPIDTDSGTTFRRIPDRTISKKGKVVEMLEKGGEDSSIAKRAKSVLEQIDK